MIQINSNRQAFLDTIAYSELGAALMSASRDGYNVLFGSTAAAPKLFESYADHPRVKTYEKHDEFIRNGKRDFTTAAGRYQITASTFDRYKAKASVGDFSPESQDQIALVLISERGALTHIDKGDFEEAIRRCAPIWASFPGGCGDQHENKIGVLKAAYVKAGGVAVA